MRGVPRRFGRNVTSGWARIATQAAIAIAITPVLVHGLGTAGYGIWVLAFSLILYLELFDFGLGTATVKYIAQSEALGNREDTKRTIATSFWTLAVPGLGALALGGLIAATFPLLFDLPPGSERTAQILVLLVAVDLAISVPSDTFGATLYALQRFDLVNATLIAVAVAQAIAAVVVLWLGGDLVALGFATVALSLLGQLSRYVIARRLVPGLSVSPRLFDRRRVRPLAALSVWYALAEASTLVIHRLDVVVVGLVVGVPEAAVYAVAQKLALLVDQLIRPMLRIFFPHSSELAARRDRTALAETIRMGTRLSTAVAGPVVIALALLAEPLLRIWVGDDFADGALVVVFLCGAAAVTAVSGTGFLMLQGAGFARRPAVLSAAEAVLNLTLSVVLGLWLGLEGVALATLIAAGLVQLGAVLPYVSRAFAIPLRFLVGPVLRAHLPAAFASLAVGWAILRTDVSEAVEVAWAAAAIAGVYATGLILFGLDAAERRLALQVVRSRSRHVVPPA